jgi:NAD(P)-dependent dehydrogenase (short-subunit alcohol dehydrogenase family)
MSVTARAGLVEGKIVAITGGASGIGRATALLAAGAGAAGLVLADRDEQALARTAKEIHESASGPVPVEEVVVDVTADEGPDAVVGRAVARFGQLDAALNAAGVEGGAHPLDVCTDEEFDAVLEVNVRALFRCVRAQLRQMYQQGSGSIVNVASAAVFGVHPGLGAYVASKSAVLALSKVAAKEAGKRGVRVNALCPGLTDTPMLRESLGVRPQIDDIAARISLGRIGRPDELAEAALWLCSDRSSFTTGTGLVVDGGRVG